MSSRIIALSALLCLSGCATRINMPEMSGVDRFYIYGATLAAPQDTGWYIPVETPYHTAITKLGKTKDSTIVIEIQDIRLSPPAPGEDFAQEVKRQESADTNPNRFTVQVHDVTDFKLGDAVCARSHMLAEDNAAKTPTGKTADMLLEAYGINCRHPDDPRVDISLAYSLRYYPGDRDPQLEQEAAAALDGLRLESLKR